MTENFMLPAHHIELWDHSLELGILACPVAIVSMVVVKEFLLPLIHLVDLGLRSLSADTEHFIRHLVNAIVNVTFSFGIRNMPPLPPNPTIFKNNICQIIMHTTNMQNSSDYTFRLIALF